MHSCRKTEFKTCRAAGDSPNDTLDTPRVVWTLGWSRVTSRMASMVSMASRRVSSCPVAIGKVKVSMTMSPGSMPQLSTRSVMSRSAIRTFHSAVRACPSSSMVSATTAAPCSLTIGMICWNREPGPSPSS